VLPLLLFSGITNLGFPGDTSTPSTNFHQGFDNTLLPSWPAALLCNWSLESENGMYLM
jgi:hypothetical protein